MSATEPRPERSARPAPVAWTGAQHRRSDLVRQVTVLVGAAVAVVAAFYGSGAFGGEEQPEVGDGALSADATPVAPAGPAFSIWSVIYTGLVLYAIWQVLPAQRSDLRQRRLGWLVLASLVLNAIWILVVQAELLALSVPVIVLLLVTLVVILVRLEERPPQGVIETVVVDGTLGLYLGWVTLATVANTAAVLASAGYTELGLGPDAWSVVALGLAGVIGVGLAVWTRGRLAVGAALVWGLSWVVVARTTGDLESTVAAMTAGISAGAVAVATIAARLARGRG